MPEQNCTPSRIFQRKRQDFVPPRRYTNLLQPYPLYRCPRGIYIAVHGTLQAGALLVLQL
jgi:hypothetical protein